MKQTALLLAASLLLAGCTIATSTVVPSGKDSSSDANQSAMKNPVISGLTASPTSTSQPGQAISIQVSAYDPKGENLRYTWSATGGTLSSTTGTLITWKAPSAAGTYIVQVLVTNDSGGSATGTLNIQVNSNGNASVSQPEIDNGSNNPGGGSNQKPSLTWAQVSPGISVYDCYFDTFTSGWVVGSYGKVRHTTDAGETWTKQDISNSGDLHAVYFLPSTGGTMGWVGGFRSLYKTTNGGASWTKLSLGSSIDYYADVTGVFFKDANKGYVTARANGHEGGLYATSDGGATWSKVSSDDSLGWLTGLADGTLFASALISQFQNTSPTIRYKSGGLSAVFDKTFEFMTPEPGSPSNLLAIWMEELYESSNGGLNWQRVDYSLPTADKPSNLYRWRGLGKLSSAEALGIREQLEGWSYTYTVMDSTDAGRHWNSLVNINMGDTRPDQTKPHFFAFDRRHAWQAYADDSKLLRIGEP